MTARRRLALALPRLLSLPSRARSGAAASARRKRLHRAAPTGVRLTRIDVQGSAAIVLGHARRNADISAFMQAIVSEDIGVPTLGRITRRVNGSAFELRIEEHDRRG